MTLYRLRWRDDIPRGGLARETDLMAVASTLLHANFVEGNPTFATPPLTAPASGAAVVYGIGGTKLPLASGAVWTLTGLPVLPARRKQTFLLLVNPAGVTSVYPSRATGLAQNVVEWGPPAPGPGPGTGAGPWNGPEALIDALNRDTGYACVGSLTVINDTDVPWTPGTAYPAPTTNTTIAGGFPAQLLFEPASTTDPPVIMRR